MGVKSLWSLLTPVGRPVMLETMEGKSMAIDSSIWLYQFQATMRDKDGRVLVNAHVLGFLRRICKLLFYGIKPVFVFDGGAPALKRVTISERKKKKSGAADSHVKVAEKLLAAQMRKEAVNQIQKSSAPASLIDKNKVPQGPVILDENTVYLEDIDNSIPKTPSRAKDKGKDPEPSSSQKKKNKFHDYDPYRLPEVDMTAAVAKVTQSSAPDPRLATEDELRAFIEEMRPEDFDVSSPAFRELPTEVQYEIIGDLRLKSRQTSHKRLQSMLRSAKTPLDFSKAQIKNLQQRNALTQQLLVTTDSISKAHVSIPIRIASERNREYLLIKNEGEGGGWVLGIREDGTQTKPIKVDEDDDIKENKSESDEDMEEITIPAADLYDSDLRGYQREMALSAIGKRREEKTGKRRTAQSSHRSIVQPQKKAVPLFEPDLESGDDDMDIIEDTGIFETIEFEDISEAIKASLADQDRAELQKAIELSKGNLTKADVLDISDSNSDSVSDDLYVPTRLDTALSFANTGSTIDHRLHSSPQMKKLTNPNTIKNSVRQSETQQDYPMNPVHAPAVISSASDSDEDDMEEIAVITGRQAGIPTSTESYNTYLSDVIEVSASNSLALSSSSPKSATPTPIGVGTQSPISPHNSLNIEITKTGVSKEKSSSSVLMDVTGKDATVAELRNVSEDEHTSPSRVLSPIPHSRLLASGSSPQTPTLSNGRGLVAENDRSRSASPEIDPTLDSIEDTHEPWDATQEIDVIQEEGEFAHFVSQVKGKDLEIVRKEIDDEIYNLNQQKKAAMRDSEDVTQQMIAQIMTMLRLFGIPYITSPMEAEAQCAELVELGLVDGIITDDSDVFLFGGQRVFKNMFNQSKTVECFLLSDLSRELGLDRDKLIRLAYLLGSDYVEGLPNVGPVVAMELLAEFPGDDGLHKFKDWWLKVQSGRDKPSESSSPIRRKIKKRFKDLYLSSDWPNPAVRDAYYHPTVDHSEEPFKWGLPDLDGLRSFFHEELFWGSAKVDELLLPIIRKMGKRTQADALNKQSNLNSFFDITAGTGVFEPRKRQAYSSRRLQELVSDHRKEQARRKRAAEEKEDGDSRSSHTSSDYSENERSPPKRKKTSSKGGKETGSAGTRERSRGRGRGQRSRGGRAGNRIKSATAAISSTVASDSVKEADNASNEEALAVERAAALNLRPRPKAKAKQVFLEPSSDEDSAVEK